MVCSWLRDARGPVCSTTRPLSIDACTEAIDEALAELRDTAVAELDRLGEVVTGVDVHEREREPAGAEGLLGEPQQDDRVLAAREEEHRPLELRGDLAHDVDRLGLERVEVGEMDGPSLRAAAHVCSPHSVFSRPDQRPSRPVPGWVQWVQPIEA